MRRTSSATYDEVTYAKMALDARHGNFKDLIRSGVAPLPVLLDTAVLGRFQPGDMFTYHVRPIMTRVRVMHVLTNAVPLILAVYLWLLASQGLFVAFTAALCLALSPTFLAHASLATTDTAISLWVVATLAALAWYGQRPGWWRLTVVAIALGLAGASKYSAVCLLPAVVLTAGWRRSAMVAAGALLLVWSLTAFTSLPLQQEGMTALLGPEQPTTELFGHDAFTRPMIPIAKQVKLPAPVVAAVQQWAHQRAGHHAFLMGSVSSQGWWYYMPLALALKSTPVELVAAVMLPVLVFLVWRRRSHAFTIVCVTIATYSASLALSNVDIGVRYALPLFPLAALCAGDAIGTLRLRAITLAALAVAALALQATESFMVAPHYLSYFNEIVGGSQNGYRYLGDSNVDWGQDLPALAAEIEKLDQGEQVCLAYWGKSNPDYYGVRAVDWREHAGCRDAKWLAVSVNLLQGQYLDHPALEELLQEEPDRRAGFSILLYRMDRPIVATALAKAWKLGVA